MPIDMELESEGDSFESHWKLLDDDKTVQCKTCNLRLNHGLDQNLLDSHVAWHRNAAKSKLKKLAKLKHAEKNDSRKAQAVSPVKAAEIKIPPNISVNMKKPILQVLVPEKKIMPKLEDTEPAISDLKLKRVKCLTCPLKTTNESVSVLKTLDILSHTYSLKKIILLVTGVEASETDIICMTCKKKAVEAFVFRKVAQMQINKGEVSGGNELFTTQSLKNEYEGDAELKPKTEIENISEDDNGHTENFYDDDFTFSDDNVDNEDTPLNNPTKTISTKSKPDSESTNICVSKKSIFEPVKAETKLKKVVQIRKRIRGSSSLTLKCNQCSKTFGQCMELLLHVRKAHTESLSVSEKNKPNKLSISNKFPSIPRLRNIKGDAIGFKQKCIKKLKPAQSLVMTFRCGICYSLFNDKAKLEIHSKEHKDTEAIMCGVCNRAYCKFPHFKRHIAKYHPEVTDVAQAEATETLLEIDDEEVRQHIVQFIRMTTIGDLVSANIPLQKEKEIRWFAHACALCGELSLSLLQAKEHKNKAHADELNSRCFICGVMYGTKDTVAFKLNTSYHYANCKKRQLKYECVICGVKFRAVATLEEHVLRSHPEQFANWDNRYSEKKCNRCGGDFKTRESLRYHRRVVCPDESEVGEFKCDQCEKKFRVKYYLIKHIERVHERQQQNHVCPVCGKLVRKLNTHMTVHSGEKPYNCRFCPAAFRVSHERTYHERKHTQETPYKCFPCNKLFNRPSSYKRHMMQHTGERPHKCSMCEAAFIQKNCLVAHMKKHTPYDRSLPLDPRPFQESPSKDEEIESTVEENCNSDLNWSMKKKKVSSY